MRPHIDWNARIKTQRGNFQRAKLRLSMKSRFRDDIVKKIESDEELHKLDYSAYHQIIGLGCHQAINLIGDNNKLA